MGFKGTKGKWKSVDGVFFDEHGNVVPSKWHFSVLGRTTLEDVFGKDEEFIKGKYNDLLKEKGPEMLEMLIEVSKHHQGGHSEIGHKIKQLIKEATEL